MNNRITYILFFITSIGFSQSPRVQAEVDTTNIRIGEQFQYTLSVNETENVIIPKLENLQGLEIVDSLQIDTIKNKLIKKYILTGFDSGVYAIPRQQLFIKNQAYLTDSILINVATVAIDTTKIKKFPIKAIKSEPYRFDDFKKYLWWILGVLLIIGLVVYFFIFKKKNTDEKVELITVLEPYQEAIQKLKKLDTKLLWQNNHIKKYYSELTGIVRDYIEKELKIPALESTTGDLIETLTDFDAINSIETTPETIQKLQHLLQEADLVKFAKSKPLAHQIESDRKDAEAILSSLKIKTIEEDETQDIQPVIIEQKPVIKQPSLLEKIVLILLTLLLVGLLSFGISKAITMSNSLKPPVGYAR